MVQKISSTWSIVYSSFHIVKFVPLHLRLCKETLFLLILKMFSWACWEMMMKKLEDWHLTKFKLCVESLKHSIPNGNFRRGYVENCQNTEDAVSKSNIRIFQVPIINFNARSFHQMVNLNGREVNQPPAIKHHSDSEIEVIQKYPLKLNHPCHKQHVERHVKLVTEASSQVCGIDCRDGLTPQKLIS